MRILLYLVGMLAFNGLGFLALDLAAMIWLSPSPHVPGIGALLLSELLAVSGCNLLASAEELIRDARESWR